MESETLEHYYNKILLWNYMGDEIINFGIECGISNLMDYVDMNCGAVASGEYSSVIDPDAASQFLGLYAGIARKRMAYGLNQVLGMGPKAKEVIAKFCHDVGRNNGGFSFTDAGQAFEALEAFMLAELPGEQKHHSVVSCNEQELKFKDDICASKKYWDEVQGSWQDWLDIRLEFAAGLFEGSGFGIKAETDGSWCIFKSQCK